MDDRFKFRIPMFTDKGHFVEFQYLDLGDEIECTLCGSNGKPQHCTGLKDKNGKLIYENDILHEKIINDVFPKGKYWIVKWDNNQARFYIELINKTGNSLTDFWHLARHDLDYEVVGNVFENEELINNV